MLPLQVFCLYKQDRIKLTNIQNCYYTKKPVNQLQASFLKSVRKKHTKS